VLIETGIQDFQAQMGHADFVNIRESKGHGDLCLFRIFRDSMMLCTKVTAWTADFRKPGLLKKGHKIRVHLKTIRGKNEYTAERLRF
jgi:hypothetical protein